MVAILVLYFWPNEVSTRSAWFWCCTLVLPVLSGMIIYVFLLRGYENACHRRSWWNYLHQQQREELIALGQKAIGVMGISYITPVASNKLSQALLLGASGLQSRYVESLQSVVNTAILSSLPNSFTLKNYQQRLELYLTDTIERLSTELGQYSGNFSVRILHDGILNDEQIELVWRKLFTTFRCVNITAISESDGMMWIDDWLDKQDESLTLSVEINLFKQPRNNEAESVSAILMASPIWLKNNNVRPQIYIHRPVLFEENIGSVDATALWGNVMPKEKWHLWSAQVKTEALSGFLNEIGRMGNISEKIGEHTLDYTYGRPGIAVSNITLICACEHASTTGEVQWVVTGDKSAQMAVVRKE